MKVSLDGLAQSEALKDAGVTLPGFDVAQMQADGRRSPRWIHIGPGNIFRVFLARIADDLVQGGDAWPVTAVVPLNPAELDVQLAAHDLLTLGVTLHEDGRRDLRVIAGICEGLAPRRESDFARLVEVVRQPSVSLMSFTITEKGYAVRDSSTAILSSVQTAWASDPHAHQPHAMALVASLLLHRFEAGGQPITLMSCDNFSHNGDRLRESVLTIIDGWAERGRVPREFVTWAQDPGSVAFPISVIDKITPRPNPQIAADLAGLGFDDMGIQTLGHTAVAGFVNTEPTEYLLVEDAFAGERPPLERAGVRFVSREVCDDFEHMKVTTCLNPLHTALALAGCLLRYPTIDSEMRDPTLAAFVHRLGWDEGLPVVVDPGIVAPADFLREVLEVRFPNPHLPDDPARIATDTSQKLPIRFGETIKAYLGRGLDLGRLTAMPLVFALWCRYLMGVGDDGEPFTPSSDPLLGELMVRLAAVELGASLTPEEVHAVLAPILANPTIFGLDLYQTPLGVTTEKLFARLITGPGAVRKTLDEEMSVA